MLQDYLNSMLLSITDEGDFKKLEKSAIEISKKIIKDRSKIVSYTLAAIDPEVSVESSVIEEARSIIVKNWKTFTANAKDTPLTFIRAVILEALSSISADINHSLLIWFSARNIVQYHKLIGKEREILLEFMVKLGNDINQNANKEWALSNNDTLPKTSLELKEVSRYALNDDTLKKYLEDASGPTNSTGVKNFESPNSVWPNSGQSWSHQFAPRAAKGIKTAIDLSLKAIVAVVNENKNTVQSSLNKALESLQTEISNRTSSLQLRSELLWWKEAGYSSSMDKSYDELDNNILGIVLANDYSFFIPLIYPKSVDYFLKETYKGLKGNATEELTLEEFFKTIQKHTEELKSILPEEEALVDKSTLLNFVTSLIWNKNELAQFEELLGIPLDIKLSSKELTTWLFHDFQLVKIINTK
ncbi:GTPase-associated system all-helical protein GASH [Formosa haliotis]|uniref:GTPase-associated system all-helical protein GASH n=1 Tax=Formosa haliotis TaxID=1555194 RepID=UPI000826C983|nr:GTPase-associated system all-helical protein GASH [Formosa haliotis]